MMFHFPSHLLGAAAVNDEYVPDRHLDRFPQPGESSE